MKRILKITSVKQSQNFHTTKLFLNQLKDEGIKCITLEGPSELELKKDRRYSWCTCGLSQKLPLCDGTHKKRTDKKPIRFYVEETKKYLICGCRQTKNPPFCDGSHNHLDKK
eukprot:gene1116-10630_t